MPMVKFKKAYLGTVAGTRWNVEEGAEFNLSAEEAAKIELDSPGTVEPSKAQETEDTVRPVTREAPMPPLHNDEDPRFPTKTVTVEPLKLTPAEKKALARSTGDAKIAEDDDAEATVRGLHVPKNDRMVRGAKNRAEATQDASAPGAVSLSPEEVAKNATGKTDPPAEPTKD